MSDNQPIYDSKVKKILERLKFKTRDEVAEEMKYKNWRSMDMYMRRKNFIYDSKEGQYISANKRVDKYTTLQRRSLVLLLLSKKRIQTPSWWLNKKDSKIIKKWPSI